MTTTAPVRERDAYEAGHIAGARLLPRGQLELRVNDDLPDPTRRILAYCEFGRISTLAAATLRGIGFQRAVALEGGMKARREAGYPVSGKANLATAAASRTAVHAGEAAPMSPEQAVGIASISPVRPSLG